MKTTKSRVMRGSVPVTLLLLAALAAGCGGGHERPERAARSAVEVRTATATLEEVPLVLRASGTAEPWARVFPGTKIMGRIDRVYAAQGDRVGNGQILATLEKRDLEAAVDQARAAVAMAEAHLENAGAQHDRMSDLHGRGSVTEKNLEDAVAAFRVARASLEQSKANLRAAEVTLSYAEIRSPVDGFVVGKAAEAGNMASPGSPLFTVEDLSRIKVVLQVPESEVVGLQRGDPVRVEFDVLQRTWDARIDRIMPAADPSSRTYDVQVVIPNREGVIRSGMFARGSFPRGARRAVLMPRQAVVRRGQLQGVFVVDADGVARLRWIRPGRDVGDRVEIISGLSEGERYLMAPPAGFADATPVVTGVEP